MNTTLSPAMDETLRYIYFEVIDRYTPEYIKTIEFEYTPWVFSLLGSIVIGLSGIFPLLIIPSGTTDIGDRKYYFFNKCIEINEAQSNRIESIFVCVFFFLHQFEIIDHHFTSSDSILPSDKIRSLALQKCHFHRSNNL